MKKSILSILPSVSNVSIESINPDPTTSTNISDFDGSQIIIHIGHGGTLYNPYNPANLFNHHKPNFVYTSGCSSGSFGVRTTTQAEEWMSSYGGMFAGVINSNLGFYGISDRLIAASLDLLLDKKDCKTFCEAHFNARFDLMDSDDSWFYPHVYKTSNYFGDPALEINFPD